MPGTAICCWPRSNATPRMPGRPSTWPRATSVSAIWSTPASGMRGESRWAAGTKKSATRCTNSRCRWSSSPWPDVQDAYLRAWELRSARAEGLYAIARRYRAEQRHRLGYLFAKGAAEIPFPEDETLFVRPDIYAWRIADEQAVCASWIDKHAEAFTLWRRLLARPDLPEDDRQRIARSRDVCAPTMIDAASCNPDTTLLQSLQHPAAGRQNVLVFATDTVAHEHEWPELTGPLDMVHPELFALRYR